MSGALLEVEGSEHATAFVGMESGINSIVSLSVSAKRRPKETTHGDVISKKNS